MGVRLRNCLVRASYIKSTALLRVNHTTETCRLYYRNQKLGRQVLAILTVRPIHFAIGRICVHSNCSVRRLFVKIHRHSKKMYELYLHHFT